LIIVYWLLIIVFLRGEQKSVSISEIRGFFSDPASILLSVSDFVESCLLWVAFASFLFTFYFLGVSWTLFIPSLSCYQV